MKALRTSTASTWLCCLTLAALAAWAVRAAEPAAPSTASEPLGKAEPAAPAAPEKLNIVPTEPSAPLPAYGPGPVYVLTLSDEDNPGEALGLFTAWNAMHLKRCLKRAERDGASLFIVKLTTNGGRIDHAQVMSEALRSVRGMRTATFSVHRAISAGALFSLSCDDIYMTPGSVIGDAYPISIGPGKEEQPPAEAPATKPPDEPGGRPSGRQPKTNEQKKMVGGWTKYMAEAARQKGHSPALAAAMIDPDIEVLAVTSGGRTEIMTAKDYDAKYPTPRDRKDQTVVVIDNDEDILMLGSRDAVKWGLAKYEANSLDEILSREGLTGRPVIDMKLTLSEVMARFFSSSFVVALLIAASILALYVELNHPSGVAGGFFLLALGLFFWANYMAGSANAVSIILVLLGAALLAVEIFFIPGFGVTGIVGAVLVAVGLIVARIPPDFFRSPGGGGYTLPAPDWGGVLTRAAVPVFAGLGLGAVGVIVLMRFFPRMPFLNRLVLQSDLASAVVTAGQPAGVEDPGQMVGRLGTAVTTLRPGGSARFDGKLLDVISDSEFIEAGAGVRIVSADSNRIVVRRA